jgi:hypothetical protein
LIQGDIDVDIDVDMDFLNLYIQNGQASKLTRPFARDEAGTHHAPRTTHHTPQSRKHG